MKLKGKHMRSTKKKAKRLPFDLSYTQSRELSWLQFNARVLHEATDKQVPLYERLKFAAIFTSNLDEFYMVRAGSLAGLSRQPGDAPDSTCGWTAAEQLERIWQATESLCEKRDKAVEAIEERLKRYGFQRLRCRDLTEPERVWLDRYFEEQIRPQLEPQLLDENHPFPQLPGGAFSVVLRLGEEEEKQLGLLPVPSSLPPLVRLPGMGVRFLLMEQLVLDYAPRLFPGYTAAGRAVIRITRSADIDPDDSAEGAAYRAQLRRLLQERPHLNAVRLEIQGKLKMPVIRELCGHLGLEKAQVFRSECPLAMGWVWQLADEMTAFPELFYPPRTPRMPCGIDPERPMLEQIREKDRLLHFPYESIAPFLQLLEEAAQDPDTKSIYLTVYRAAKQSRLLAALEAAARNGKQVTVLFELRARFDEQNNMEWAERLETAGCTVLHGAKGYKCHAKLCLITRERDGLTEYLTQIGTGNYNEKTAELYTDLSLMTADPEIGADAAAIFRDLAAGAVGQTYQILLAAPAGIKPALRELIAAEIEKAQAGLPSGITIQCNSLTDRQMIDALQQASAAGVPVRLLVRGICCLVPGIEGLTENIHIYSIVGRFLEHERIYAFGAQQETLYIGSSDLMTRNLDRRVEVLCPMRSAELAERVRQILRCQLSDTAKRHELHRKKGYLPVAPAEGETPFDAQATFAADNEAAVSEPV